uniref:Uncharacterized protein n=1 Tax=Davidia involucrata TaxID=16924 RepID=A0A5B7BVV2_DAVIN
MLDLQQGLAGSHLCSFNPVYQSNGGGCVSTKTTDFDFWSEQRTRNFNNYDDFGSSEIEFQTEAQMEDDYGAYSTPVWAKRDLRYEASPLLPYNHHYSYPSPTSRLKAIADGRRELMEMIQNMPENSYELSLKDMVDEQQHVMQGVQQDIVTVEGSSNFETQVKIKQKKKQRNTRRGQISRSESMDSGVFLLKMFFPTSLGSKKKSTAGNRSKVSPRPSFEGSEKPVYKEWWKIRFLFTGENKNGEMSRISGSTRSSNSSSSSTRSSSSSRNAESNFTPGCWSFRRRVPLLNENTI